MFKAFVKSVGIYPTGSPGAPGKRTPGGWSVDQHETSLLTPAVKVFFSAKSKAPIPQQIIDLAKLVGREKIVGRDPRKTGIFLIWKSCGRSCRRVKAHIY